MISSNVKPFCVGCELPDNAHVPGRGQRKCYGYRIMLERNIGRHVMPINNYIIATEPLSDDTTRQLIANNACVSDSRFVVTSFDKILIFRLFSISNICRVHELIIYYVQDSK